MNKYLQDKSCYVCGNDQNLHNHEVFYGTANRKISIKHKFQVWLCGRHHNLSNDGVHYNKKLDLELKRKCQTEYEENNSREDFLRLLGKSYL